MNVRKANNKDLDSISAIFRETVRLINSKDYAEREIEVWSAVADNIEFWNKIIIEEDFFVVENEDKIIGFSSLRNDGYLHFMYVHHQYQNCGVASLLLNTIELKAAEMKLNEILIAMS